MRMTKNEEKMSGSAVCDYERMMQDECGTIARCKELLREVAEAVSRFQKALPESIHIDLEAQALHILEHLRLANRERFLGEQKHTSDALNSNQAEDSTPFDHPM